MAERLTFTLAGRDELSRVLNNTADSADRLRLRLAGITGDANGRLHDLQGRFVSVDEAQRRLDGSTQNTRNRFAGLSDAADKLGEALKANLISLAPAAIPATAALAGAAATVAAQLGAAGAAAGAFTLALVPQITAIGDTVDAQKKYQDAVLKSGVHSEQAAKAQLAYQQQLSKLPPETQKAAVGVGLLRDNFQAWSDSLSGDVLSPFNKGVAIANTLLPKTSGLVKGASGQFDRLVTLLGGAISTPGFDRLNDRFTAFADKTLSHAVDQLTIFLAKADVGEVGGGLQKFLDYARANGPAVWDTLKNVGDALIHILQAGSDVGVSMLDLINALSGIVAAVPPDAIAALLQLAVAIKAVKLAAAGADAAKLAIAGLGVQVAGLRAASAGAPGVIGGVGAAITGLSRTAKIALAGTGLGLLLITLGSLSAASQAPKADVDKLTTSLAELGRTGKNTGEAVRVYGKDLSGLGDALRTLARPSNLDKTQQFLTRLIGMDSTPVKNAKEAFDGIDEALSNLVSQGKADLAAAALGDIEASLKKQGFTAKEVEAQLDDYKNALAGQALEQKLAAESMGLFGDQAQQVQTKLDAQKRSADGLRQSIQALNDVNRKGIGAEADLEQAIDDTAKAAGKNRNALHYRNGELDLGTQKSRDAYRSLSDLAAKTDAATSAAREQGRGWGYLKGQYDKGRASLIKSAQQMGLTKEEAKRLADQILATPDKTAYLRGDLKDLKAKLADAKERLRKAPSEKKTHIRGEIEDLKRKIREAQAAINGVHGKTVYINLIRRERAEYNTLGRPTKGEGGQSKYAAGGLVGFPVGGPVYGPGTGTSDSILARLSNGEYVIPAVRVREYGVGLFDAIRAGKLSTAKAAPKPGMAAVPMTAASPTSGSDRPQVTYNVYPRASVISAEDLRLIQRQEEARQRVGRPR